MCGVAGAVGDTALELSDVVPRMNRTLTHRGPDAGGEWSEVQGERLVAFGHRRLSIIDLSERGRQPMLDRESGCVISYNGEVYNFITLREELRALGASFESDTDTEVILKAYARWGLDGIRRLRGMFALAIWDPAAKHVVLVRDRMGIKPLYVARVSRDGRRGVLFASEIRAILASGLVPRKLDQAALGSYVWNGFVVGPQTIVAGVELLPAGALATIDLDDLKVRERRYWQLPRASDVSSSATSDDELRERLQEAVRIRLVTDVPLGIFLSGGIDSSAITALAQRAAEAPVKTFNVAFQEARYDESVHARAVAKALGTDHHEVLLTESRFVEQLPQALRSLDQPTFDGINTYVVSRAVREAGITVALAGTGGDEVFGGYSSFRELPLARRIAAAARAVPDGAAAAAAELVVRLKTGKAGAVRPQTRWGKLADVLATHGGFLELYQVSYALFRRSFARDLLLAGEPPSVSWGLPSTTADELRRGIAEEPELHRVSMLELSLFLRERLLRDTDSTSMASALEVRVPLIDHEVLEAVAALPAARRFEPLGKKQLLRDLALSELDPALFDRPKAGFELPLQVWCTRGLGSELSDTLLDINLCHKVGLNAEAVNRLWRAFRAQAPGIYWSRIWSLFTLLWWCREHDVYA
jgi:asparagine synthase (glutamine-hydrolysing)